MTTDLLQIVIYHKTGRQTFPLVNGICWTVGRVPNNAIAIDDLYISRHHAALIKVDPEIYLADLGSRNGSFINGRRVIMPTTLHNGDRLRLGNTEMDIIIPPCRKKLSTANDETVPIMHPILTPSEERVFWQVVQGFTNKEIGRRLQISPRTVQTHLSSIMTKLTLENRSQIVRFAFEHQFQLQGVPNLRRTG
jgi:DNA-binding CsgD family transcriptional regulator